MESAFLFEDTPDQRQATEDVKRDMESPRPMDRLICGDVGYGKTEVAIRAAFKAVQDGKQVAVLVPPPSWPSSTCDSFSERLAGLSRPHRCALAIPDGQGAARRAREAGGRRAGHRDRNAPAALQRYRFP
jgi:primosomal protein N'